MTGKYFILFIIGILIAIVTSHNLPKRAVNNPSPQAGKDASKTQSQNSSVELFQKDSGSQTTDQNNTTTEPQPTETTQIIKAKVTSRDCSQGCRPSWLGLFTTMFGTVSADTHLMCNFKTAFPECGKSQTPSCGNSFICCPLHCLKEINTCWQGTFIKDVCIPQIVPPAWAMQMANAFFSMG